MSSVTSVSATTRSPELLKPLYIKLSSKKFNLSPLYRTNEQATRDAIALVLKTYQHLDVLVLNAGVLELISRTDLQTTTTDSLRAYFSVNFFSLLYTVQAALPALRSSENGGRIIFVSSGAAVSGTPTWGVSNASKAAMNSFCLCVFQRKYVFVTANLFGRTLANEEPDIVSVALRPDAGFDSRSWYRQNALQKFVEAYEGGNLVKPEDAGHIIAALSLNAPKALSGKFVSWNGEECKEFRRS